MGGPKIGNFPLLYLVKMFLPRWMGGSKKPQNTLTSYKNGPLVKIVQDLFWNRSGIQLYLITLSMPYNLGI